MELSVVGLSLEFQSPSETKSFNSRTSPLKPIPVNGPYLFGNSQIHRVFMYCCSSGTSMGVEGGIRCRCCCLPRRENSVPCVNTKHIVAEIRYLCLASISLHGAARSLLVLRGAATWLPCHVPIGLYSVACLCSVPQPNVCAYICLMAALIPLMSCCPHRRPCLRFHSILSSCFTRSWFRAEIPVCHGH